MVLPKDALSFEEILHEHGWMCVLHRSSTTSRPFERSCRIELSFEKLSCLSVRFLPFLNPVGRQSMTGRSRSLRMAGASQFPPDLSTAPKANQLVPLDARNFFRTQCWGHAIQEPNSSHRSPRFARVR